MVSSDSFVAYRSSHCFLYSETLISLPQGENQSSLVCMTDLSNFSKALSLRVRHSRGHVLNECWGGKKTNKVRPKDALINVMARGDLNKYYFHGCQDRFNLLSEDTRRW